MRRVIVSLGMSALPLVSAILFLAPSAPTIHARETARAQELRQLLRKTVQYGGVDDVKVTLEEVLNQLAKIYNLSFDLNEQALRDELRKRSAEKKKKEGEVNKDTETDSAAKYPVADPDPLPPMNTRLKTVIQRILLRVSPSVMYIIRDDVIEITTLDAVRKEFFPDRPSGPLPPLVSDSFDKLPLETSLKELSHASGRNIILDGRVAKEAQTPVTAVLKNAPLDTAIRLLADMAGLKMVALDNVLYVTSKENAKCLMAERQALRGKSKR